MLILNPDAEAGLVEALRSTLVLMAIFFTMAVKRGISERGIEKLYYVIPWDQIQKIYISPYQTSRIELLVTTQKHQKKLYFSQHQLKKLVYEIQKRDPQVMVEESLKNALKSPGR